MFSLNSEFGFWNSEFLPASKSEIRNSKFEIKKPPEIRGCGAVIQNSEFKISQVHWAEMTSFQYFEDRLPEYLGELRALVATASLELGIDMAAVDLVVLVESPNSVARGLQRVGRAGHQVGAPSKARVFPKHRGDLLGLHRLRNQEALRQVAIGRLQEFQL